MRNKTAKPQRNQGRTRLGDAQRLQGLFAGEGVRQLLMPLVAGAAETRRGLMEWTHQVGLEALRTLFMEDAVKVAGPKGKHLPNRSHHHWGSAPTVLEFGGRRISVVRPRVRRRDGAEVSLPTVKHLQQFDPMSEVVLNQILLGVSTRGYDASLPAAPVGTKSRGTSRSAVSRRLVKNMRAKMRDHLSRKLDDVDLVAMMIDGIGIGEHTIVVALGVQRDGSKIVLGMRQGSTENATVCTAMLQDMQERGLKTAETFLCVIDGGKGIRKSIRDVFGDLAIVQRCQLHKRRNVRDHLGKSKQVGIDRQLREAYASTNVKTARKKLKQVISWLERNGEATAAASLREGLEETLTVIKLGLPPVLRSFFSNTNAIENLMGSVRKSTRNVKRWRNANMASRWSAVAIERAEASFRRIKGHRNLGVLIASLKAFRHDLDLEEQVS